MRSCPCGAASTGGPTRFQLLSKEIDRPLEREFRRLGPMGIAQRLGEPVAGPRLPMDGHLATGRAQLLLEGGDSLVGFVRIRIGDGLAQCT
jgi:hypothetical protein